MSIDPTTDVGKIRLRVGDYQDLPFFPDSVYAAVIVDSGGNLKVAAKSMAVFILGMLAKKTRRKLNQLEVYGNEQFENYREFLLLTVSNPAFMPYAPIPYGATAEFNPIEQFQSDWNSNYSRGTESQQLAVNAVRSPNDDSLYGYGAINE